MEYFHPKVDKYLARWILRDTWHTGNAHDSKRFYHFAKAMHLYHSTGNKSQIKETISKAVEQNHPNFEATERERIAAERASEVTLIADYITFGQDLFRTRRLRTGSRSLSRNAYVVRPAVCRMGCLSTHAESFNKRDYKSPPSSQTNGG